MEEGTAAEPARRTTRAVTAAERLRTAGWWELSEGEKAALRPLLSAGLEVGVNLNFRRLGLAPALVRGRVRGRASLWDLVGEGSGALRSYYSSSLGSVMLAMPAASSAGPWRTAWRKRMLEDPSVHPLEDVRLLSAPLGAFNEESGTFDFFWDRLPARGYGEAGYERADVVAPAVVDALNSILANPTAEGLEALAKGAGLGPEGLAEAPRFVREFPLGWRFRGPKEGEAGLIVLYERIGGELFGGIRAAVRNVPYSVLEAWGRGDSGFVYFAELVVPAAALAETSEYLRKVSAPCAESFSNGFYETSQLQSFPLSRKIADRKL